MARVSVWLPGLEHSNGLIPNASRIGSTLCSGGISGAVPISRNLPEDLNDEIAQMFKNVGSLLDEGGATFDDVIQMTVYAADRKSIAEALNRHWLEVFPHRESRPARHIVSTALPAGMRIQCELTAMVER